MWHLVSLVLLVIIVILIILVSLVVLVTLVTQKKAAAIATAHDEHCQLLLADSCRDGRIVRDFTGRYVKINVCSV